MKLIIIICALSLLFLLSCHNDHTGIGDFRTGTFQTFLDNSEIKSIATRNDSLQFENYNNVIDTFKIEWKSNFEYVLSKINPKSELDSTPFLVKIIGFKNNSYTFKAHYKGSNFKQTGKATKLKN
jgi:hypothetical protein